MPPGKQDKIELVYYVGVGDVKVMLERRDTDEAVDL